MANAQVLLSVGLEDDMGVKTRQTLNTVVADTATIAQLITDAQAYCAILDPVTDALGLNVHIEIIAASTGLKTATTVKDPLENGALFTFDVTGTRYHYSVLVPSFAEAKRTGAKVDLADADVLAYYTWLHTNGTHYQVVDKGWAALSTFRRFKLNARKHRKPEAQLSTEVP